MSVSSVDFLSGLAASSSASAQKSAGNGADFLEILRQERQAADSLAASPTRDTEPEEADDIGPPGRDRPSEDTDGIDADDMERPADAASDRPEDRPDRPEPQDDTSETAATSDADAATEDAAEEPESAASGTPDQTEAEGSSHDAATGDKPAKPQTDSLDADTTVTSILAEAAPTQAAPGTSAQTAETVPASQAVTTEGSGDPTTVAGVGDGQQAAHEADGLDAAEAAASGAAAAAEQPAMATVQAVAGGSQGKTQAGGNGPAGKAGVTGGPANPQSPVPAADTPADAGKQAGQDSLGARGDWSSIAAEMARAVQGPAGTARQAGTFGATSSVADAATSPVLGGTLSGTPLTKGTVLAAARAAGTPSAANAADQVIVRIQRAVAEGVDQIKLQLRPAQMGQVDIRLDVGTDGRVQATITAERPETLQMLQRDARMLEQALQDAGLEADSGSLNFGLRDQGGEASNHDGRDGAPQLGSGDGTDPEGIDDTGMLAANETLHGVTLGGVDVRV